MDNTHSLHGPGTVSATGTSGQAGTTLFCLLGPVRVWRSGVEVATGSPQQRTVMPKVP